jgi:DNA ligase (NAD+)
MVFTMNIREYLDGKSTQYYNGSPTISDEEFDHLAESINYSSVGAKQHENVCKHIYPMYSLSKYYVGESNEPIQEYALVKSLKLDGAAISILYLDGKLTQVLTRGDGIEGRDITAHFIARKNLVPLEIKKFGTVQVTGEIVAPKHIENSRNYASGALNLKDSSEFCTRDISFFAYGVFPYQSNTYVDDMLVLELLGFNTIFVPCLDGTFECDGTVFRINDNTTFTRLGYTAKSPRGAYALKTRQEAVETELLGVEWSTGRSGKVTPTAILKPIYIGDKLVSRATLNNPKYIEMLDLKIGCTVALIMGGEVIPRLTHRVD